MNYTHRLATWLHTLETRHSQEIQLGLSRVLQVAAELNLRAANCPVITVGGTNGKGSTVELLASIYREAGYSVAVYTSPHLIRFNERIRFNGVCIEDESLADAFDCIEKARGHTALTYFESTTLAALWYFSQCRPDIMILEVGLGGRLDAVNVMDADLAVITGVALDHEYWLGNTVEAIAREKAGILREGKPFIYADKPMPQAIHQIAEICGSRGYKLGQEYSWQPGEQGITLEIQDSGAHASREHYLLPGSNLHPNAVAAAAVACHLLQARLSISPEQIHRGIKRACLSGRFQILQRQPLILADVAHNPQAAVNLAARLEREFPGKAVHAVFSAFSDKNIAGTIAPLKPVVKTWYPSRLPVPRGANEEQLRAAFDSNEISDILCYNNPILAFKTALKQAAKNELIIVYGSFVLVGMILEAWHEMGNG